MSSLHVVQVSHRLTEQRLAAGLTQAQLAERIGVHETTVYRWEVGAVDMPQRRMRDLAALFGVTVGYLMGWEAPTHTVAAS